MSEAMDTMENTIQRARMALGAGVPETDVFDAISKQETPDIGFLAIQAAKLLLQESDEDNESSTTVSDG